MSNETRADRILILDFGAQTTQLIARRVRECGVYCEVNPFNMNGAAIDDYAPRGVILSGGPGSVTGDPAPLAPERVWRAIQDARGSAGG